MTRNHQALFDMRIYENREYPSVLGTTLQRLSSSWPRVHVAQCTAYAAYAAAHAALADFVGVRRLFGV